MKLNSLFFNYGSMKDRKRVARGDRGKKPGRGFKGQKSRSGVSIGDFQGGQMPLMRRLPKQKSFFTRNSVKPQYEAISLKTIDSFYSSKFLNKEIKLEDLRFLLRNKKSKIKLIGESEFDYSIESNFASENIKKNFASRLKLI